MPRKNNSRESKKRASKARATAHQPYRRGLRKVVEKQPVEGCPLKESNYNSKVEAVDKAKFEEDEFILELHGDEFPDC